MTAQEDLIRRSQAGDRAASEQLVEENTGLIWAVVRRFLGRDAEPEDLYQLGCLGFLKAVEGFDLNFGTQFSTYAVPKIAGEIRRFLRDDGTIKVSRSLKEESAAVKAARSVLIARLNREPTLLELSQHTGISPEQIALAETATAKTESIHQETGEDGFTLENVLTDTQSEEQLVEQIALRQAIAGLPEREAMVVKLRYYHGLTQDAVARVLHISQVQVSRIEKKAITHLRQAMQ